MTIPITVLTGFLGSGKTTLLNHVLRSPLLSRALVVVNELGTVSLDHLLVKEVREDVLLLDSGCMCCSIRGDLVDTLLAEASGDSAPPFDRVIVETTGLADPTPIVGTLVRHAALTEHYHLDAVVTAIDAEQGLPTLENQDEAVKQLLLADDIVLTKQDVADEATIERVRETIARLNPRARVFSSDRGVLDWKPILEWNRSTVAARLDVAAPDESHGHAHHHGEEVRSFAVRADRAVDFRSLALWLSTVSQFHGEKLLRVKGLLRVEGEPGPVVVQSVQHVVYPVYSMPQWPCPDQSSRLMIITRGMSPALVEELRSSLESTVAGVADSRSERPTD